MIERLRVVDRLRVFTAACLYYSGVVALARWWQGRAGRQLLILNYHRASGGDLRRHLGYLRRHYRVLPLEAALEELYQPDGVGAQRGRRMAVALTFDDGYQDNYTHAFALARELEVPITVFLIPGYVESGRPFWWVEAKGLVERAPGGRVWWEGREYDLTDGAERAALARRVDGQVRYAGSVAERERVLAQARRVLGGGEGGEEAGALPLRWEQVREMAASGWVTFGAHTMQHPLLACLRDEAEVRWEVRQCREVLERHLGQPIRIFAYPVGQLQHIGNTALAEVKQAQYDWALTTLYGFNTLQSDRYLLRRLEVDVDQHWLVIAAKSAGLWGVFSRLRWNRLVRTYVLHAPA